MGMRIKTNLPSLKAQKQLFRTNRSLETNCERLSSGKRINSDKDDAAGLGISEKLKADIEYQNLKDKIDRLSSSTKFNGKLLLKGEGSKMDFQVGANNKKNLDRIRYDTSKINSSTSSLGINNTSIQTKYDAQGNLKKLSRSLDSVSGLKADLGAMQNRLLAANGTIQKTKENYSAANSRIMDTEYANETAKNARLNILSSAGSAVLEQANNLGAMAVKLIG